MLTLFLEVDSWRDVFKKPECKASEKCYSGVHFLALLILYSLFKITEKNLKKAPLQTKNTKPMKMVILYMKLDLRKW